MNVPMLGVQWEMRKPIPGAVLWLSHTASLKTVCALSTRVLVTEWEDTLLSNGIQKAVAHLILTPFSGFF